MKTTKIFKGFIFFISVMLLSVSAVYAAGGWNGWTSETNAANHYCKHRNEDSGWANDTQRYYEAPQELAQSSTDSFVGKDGRTYRFNSATGIFGVYNANGLAITIFKPSNPSTYWKNKVDQNSQGTSHDELRSNSGSLLDASEDEDNTPNSGYCSNK
ncbi:hypothetical protein [Rosenbergiella collisarenosi]|uniref:hypothetical protein n=1 Tax=Rosenbergiella collisarenosi TaxID=1544695 RepID=UPI001F4E7EB3|nr:hypothetical protein [Rosenbergiella collisarenosi]